MKSKCEYCKFRYSWDCDDGLPYPKDGCDSFQLDESTLSDKQREQLELLKILNKK